MIYMIPVSIVAGFLAWVLKPGWHPSRLRLIASLAVFMPVLILSAAAVISQLVHNAAGGIEVSGTANALVVAGMILLAVFIAAAVGCILRRKNDLAAGIGFSVSISFFIILVELILLEWLGGV
jgi:hypothetical protein